MPRAVRDETAFDRAASTEGTSGEGCRATDRSGAAPRRHTRYPMARVCGRLGLCRARPAHSPSRRARRESHLARPITRNRIDRSNVVFRVTFADEAIRGVKFERRLTLNGKAALLYLADVSEHASEAADE